MGGVRKVKEGEEVKIRQRKEKKCDRKRRN